MAISPAFVNTPRLVNTIINYASGHSNITIFEAGVSGSIVRQVLVRGYSPTALRLQFFVNDGAYLFHLANLNVPVCAVSALDDLPLIAAVNLIDAAYIPGLPAAEENRYLTLPAGASLVCSGDVPADLLGEQIMVCVIGADY